MGERKVNAADVFGGIGRRAVFRGIRGRSWRHSGGHGISVAFAAAPGGIRAATVFPWHSRNDMLGAP